MIRPDRQVVRRLRRRVRAAIDASPALRRERRRVRRRWTQNLPLAALRAFVPLAILGGVSNAAKPQDALPFLAGWTLAVTLFRVGQLVGALNRGPVTMIFYALPVGNEAVFRHQVAVVARGGLWLALDWLAFGVFAASLTGRVADWIAAPVFALAQASTALVVACGLALWRPRFPFAALGYWLIVGLWILLQVGKGSTAPVIRTILHGILTTTPGGWLASAQGDALAGGWAGWLIAAALAGASAFTLRYLYRVQCAAFSLERLFGYDNAALGRAGDSDDLDAADPALDAGDALEPGRVASPARAAAPTEADLAACRAKIDELLTAAPGLAHHSRGWLEARITRLLSVRQRMMLDFLQPRGPRWGREWLTAFVLIAIAGALRAVGYTDDWVAALPLVALVFFALPTFGGIWVGMQGARSMSGQIGVHAFLPLGFFELAGTMLTVNVLRCIAAAPLVLIAVRHGFTSVPLPWTDAVSLTLRGLAAVVAAMPFWTLLAFSQTSNDTSARRWFTLSLILVLCMAVFGGGALGIALFVAEGAGAQLACATLLLALSYGVVLLYGWAWGRGIFDLIAKPTQL